MPEYFELSFFLDKSKIENQQQEKANFISLIDLKEGKNSPKEHKCKIITNREVLFDIYEKPDYYMYQISLSDLIFTERNINSKMTQLIKFVDMAFSNVGSILFSTGIYELTYDYTICVKRITDFNKFVFSNFPILFFRQGCEYGYQPKYTCGNTLCIINIGAQDIMADPIQELMEDYSLTFDEANKMYESTKK